MLTFIHACLECSELQAPSFSGRLVGRAFVNSESASSASLPKPVWRASDNRLLPFGVGEKLQVPLCMPAGCLVGDCIHMQRNSGHVRFRLCSCHWGNRDSASLESPVVCVVVCRSSLLCYTGVGGSFCGCCSCTCSRRDRCLSLLASWFLLSLRTKTRRKRVMTAKVPRSIPYSATKSCAVNVD
jgi:hypothetical protein